MMKLEKKALAYWKEQTEKANQCSYDELRSADSEKWQSYIQRQLLAAQRPIRTILVIEAGPTYLGVILAKMGYQVTEIDLSGQTESQEKQIESEFAIHMTWKNDEDITRLSFADESFDAVVTRNTLCNLQNMEATYQEWLRVLKTGGVLLNFGVNWYRSLLDQKTNEKRRHKQGNVYPIDLADFYLKDETTEAQLAKQLPLNRYDRPLWDHRILEKFHVQRIAVDDEVNRKILGKERQEHFESTPLFVIMTVK